MHDTTQKDTSQVTSEIASSLQTWRTRTLNAILGIAAIAAVFVIAPPVVAALRDPSQWPAAVIFGVIYLFVVGLAVFRRLNFYLRAWGLLLMGYAGGLFAFARAGLAGEGQVYLLALPVLAMVLIGVRSGFLAAAFSVLLYAFFSAAAHLGWLANWLIIHDNPLSIKEWLDKGADFGMLLVALMVLQWLYSRFQTGALQATMEREAQVNAARTRLQARTGELDHRARRLEAVVSVSRGMASLFDLDEMLAHVTGLIKEQFGLDAVAIYLAGDPDSGVVLRSSAGTFPEVDDSPALLETVQQMVGGGAGRIVQLPAEKAPSGSITLLRLHTGGQLTGVLAVRVGERTPLDDEDVPILQIVADQIGVAVDNARLFGEAQVGLRELDALSRRYAAEAWERYGQMETMHYSYGGVTCSAQEWQAAREQAHSSGKAFAFTGKNGDGETVQSLAVPVNLRGLTIGVLGFHRPAESGAWRAEEIDMVRMIADRLALAADNLRLLQDTRRRAAREQLVGEISDRMQRAADMEALMRITAEELNRALGGSHTFVRMGVQTGLDGEDELSHEAQEES